MQQPNLLTRGDTMFGVCEAIGEDLGIPANLLRVALAAGLFFSPVAVVGTYVVMGATVAFSRWMAPKPLVAAPEPAVGVETATVEVEAEPQLALAA